MAKTLKFLGSIVLFSLSICSLAHAASASFRITAVLLDPVEMAATQENSHLAKTPIQDVIAATLATTHEITTQVHVSALENEEMATCKTGQCKGDTVELSHVSIKPVNQGAKQTLDLEATDKLLRSDKPGQYVADMDVLLATV